MYSQPDKERLKRLDVSNFEIGQTILFCPDCDWQADQPGMAVAQSKCPECNSRLHVTKLDKELNIQVSNH